MNDIRRNPQAPHLLPPTPPRPTLPRELPPLSQPTEGEVSPAVSPPPKKRRQLGWILLSIFVALVVVVVASLIWYTRAQRPVQMGVSDKIEVVIEPGMSPSQIASALKEKNLIRSELAFDLYTRQQGVQHRLQAGHYRLAPTETLSAIVEQLLQGKLAQFTITFYPGATLFDPTDIADNKRTDVYTMLRRAGYTDQEVRAALGKTYDHPLFVSKPAGSSLEGYVYGETYQFNNGASVEDVLTHTFDVFYQKIQEKNLIAELKKQKLTLHQGIILASIIEREVSGRVEDQRQVSQVFHLRLKRGVSLGADATFMYAAQQRNVPPSITLDSPYNTRIHTGLPPGPIAAPNITALEAAALPASGDYLYFVSGDDGTTHFARTNAEHEENTQKYCTTLCQAL